MCKGVTLLLHIDIGTDLQPTTCVRKTDSLNLSIKIDEQPGQAFLKRNLAAV